LRTNCYMVLLVNFWAWLDQKVNSYLLFLLFLLLFENIETNFWKLSCLETGWKID
jgi:hypothetical protein